jgi:hypothetical protein
MGLEQSRACASSGLPPDTTVFFRRDKIRRPKNRRDGIGNAARFTIS